MSPSGRCSMLDWAKHETDLGSSRRFKRLLQLGKGPCTINFWVKMWANKGPKMQKRAAPNYKTSKPYWVLKPAPDLVILIGRVRSTPRAFNSFRISFAFLARSLRKLSVLRPFTLVIWRTNPWTVFCRPVGLSVMNTSVSSKESNSNVTGILFCNITN